MTFAFEIICCPKNIFYVLRFFTPRLKWTDASAKVVVLNET